MNIGYTFRISPTILARSGVGENFDDGRNLGAGRSLKGLKGTSGTGMPLRRNY
jgi:hypothetical protein